MVQSEGGALVVDADSGTAESHGDADSSLDGLPTQSTHIDASDIDASDESHLGAPCRVAYVEHASGTSGILQAPCTSCSCQDGELDCRMQPQCAVPPALPCAEPIVSDPVEVSDSSFDEDTVALDVSVGPACGRRDFSLCFEPDWLQTYAKPARLHVIHDSHVDECNGDPNIAAESARLVFTLRPMSEQLRDEFGVESVAFETNYGKATLGRLGCADREAMAEALDSKARDGVNRNCKSDADCASTDVRPGCLPCSSSLAVATGDLASFEDEILSVDELYCEDFDDECDAVDDTCVQSSVAACITGVCTLVSE